MRLAEGGWGETGLAVDEWCSLGWWLAAAADVLLGELGEWRMDEEEEDEDDRDEDLPPAAAAAAVELAWRLGRPWLPAGTAEPRRRDCARSSYPHTTWRKFVGAEMSFLAICLKPLLDVDFFVDVDVVDNVVVDCSVVVVVVVVCEWSFIVRGLFLLVGELWALFLKLLLMFIIIGVVVLKSLKFWKFLIPTTTLVLGVLSELPLFMWSCQMY